MEAQLKEVRGLQSTPVIRFDQLVPFLRDRNPQARQIALEHLLPHTVQGSAYRDTIFFKGSGGGGLKKPKDSDIIRDLKLLCRDQLSVAHDAFRALVNLSDSSMVVNPLSEVSFLTFIVSYIINPHSICADLASMLLSNLTSSSQACSVIINMKVSVIAYKAQDGSSLLYPVDSRSGTCPAPVPFPSAEPEEVLALPLLIDAFVQGASMSDISDLSKRKRKGELNFLASVFANLTVSPAGRQIFLTPHSYDYAKQKLDDKKEAVLEFPLAKIVPFTEHKDSVRRKGVASTIKQAHKAMLSPETAQVAVSPSKVLAPGVDALPYLLLPLAGPDEFDLDDQEKLLPPLQFLPPEKKRESDPSIRLTHIEALLLLCHTRWGREYQREHGVYEIIREFHMQEKDEKIQEHVERLVVLLKSEEPKVQNVDEEEEDVQLDQVAAQIEGKKADEDDDEDMIIEEI
ncbi:cytoplasmic protein [Coprinopsis sp. MPI-PUGE-AT-0042]|nr:cytoplasmic protein [Coprinopsis sp. MPI-PUGE-AT-0042]